MREGRISLAPHPSMDEGRTPSTEDRAGGPGNGKPAHRACMMPDASRRTGVSDPRGRDGGLPSDGNLQGPAGSSKLIGPKVFDGRSRAPVTPRRNVFSARKAAPTRGSYRCPGTPNSVPRRVRSLATPWPASGWTPLRRAGQGLRVAGMPVFIGLRVVKVRGGLL
jgi:hypothetical protein